MRAEERRVNMEPRERRGSEGEEEWVRRARAERSPGAQKTARVRKPRRAASVERTDLRRDHELRAPALPAHEAVLTERSWPPRRSRTRPNRAGSRRPRAPGSRRERR